MKNKERQKIVVETYQDVSQLGQITKQQLLDESDKYDPENYDPLENLTDKEILIPKNKTEILTIRLTPRENQGVSQLADEIGLSKSAFVRMVVKKALKEHELIK